MENKEDQSLETQPIGWPQDNTENLLQRHTVYFEFADLGCIIQIGCKKFCFSDNNKALEEFIKYVKNPKEAHENWNK